MQVLEQLVSLNNLPKHVAVIMDGNGRWAKAKGKPRVFGHKAGVKAVRETVSVAAKLKLKALTLFAFSSENWQRPKAEINVLMELFITVLKREVRKLNKNNIQLRVIGNLDAFSDDLQSKIKEAEKLTVNNTGLVLNIAANYGGQWDILEATKKIACKVKNNQINIEQINNEFFTQHLTMSDLPPVDLLIRTSGEKRISNFMLWQLAYAEFYFVNQFWPDFNQNSFIDAVTWYVKRERRFGVTGEQISAVTNNDKGDSGA